MSTCPSCGTALEPGTKFCHACGTQIPQTPVNPPVESPVAPHVESPVVPPVAAPQVKPKNAKKIPKKLLLIGGAALVAIAAIIVVICLLVGGGEKPHALYMKDGELFYTDFSKNKPVEITSNLLNGEDVDDFVSYESLTLGMFTTTRNNGNRIFYPDRIDSSSDGITLYCRDVSKPNENPIKIDSSITSYAVNADGTRVVYLKGNEDEGVLYIHDLTDKTKIASEVLSFYVSDDFKKVGYLTSNDALYCWYANNENKEKLASDIDKVIYVTDDLSAVYYIKDNALYRHEEKNNDKVKIASDVDEVLAVYNTGEVYYTRKATLNVSVITYIDDDVANSDAYMTAPTPSNYPTYADYMDAYENYQHKVYRDYLRNYQDDEQTRTSLCYYNGKKEITIAENMGRYTISNSSAVIVIEAIENDNIQKLKMSELDAKSIYNGGSYEIRSMVSNLLSSATEQYLVVGGEKEEIEQTSANIYGYCIADDGSSVYFLDNYTAETSCGNLYKITIKNGTATSPAIYDSEVYDSSSSYAYDHSYYLVGGDKILYFKCVNIAAASGDLYIDHKRIDYDVSMYRQWPVSLLSYEDGAVVYFTDYANGSGTLKTYADGKRTKVTDDVMLFSITQDGGILYLQDYSLIHRTGTLFLYKGGKRERVDEDVSAMIWDFDSKIMGMYIAYGGW